MVANNSLVRPAGYFLGEKTVAHDFFAPLGRLVQVGFHRADCLHQLILANLKLGHYSKAKAIGLQRIWWLVVGGFWGLTLFFLGVLAGSFFFQVNSCFCWDLQGGSGDVPKCEVKDSGVK